MSSPACRGLGLRAWEQFRVSGSRMGRRTAKLRCVECRAADGEPRELCAECGVVRCMRCPEPCVGCERLAQLCALLAGDADRVPPEPSPAVVSKTLLFVLDLGEVRDVTIVPSGVDVRAPGWAESQNYGAATAPHILRRLMSAMGLRHVRAPIVGTVPAQRPYGARATPQQLAWLLPAPDGLEARFRPAHSGGRVAPQPIPADGPLSLPTPVALSFRTIFVDHVKGMTCPFCAEVAWRHRAVRGTSALVCAACGRSFVPAAGS